MIKNTCCFTGLRPQKLTFTKDNDTYNRLMEKLDAILVQLIERYDVKQFISGMALGWDTWCAEKILSLKNVYDNIMLCCVLPCKQQDRYWSFNDRIKYAEIIKKSDSIIKIQEYYTSDCMIKRNKKMVDESMFVVALWDGQSGGTEQTVNYALSCDRNIIVINPHDLSIRIHKSSN